MIERCETWTLEDGSKYVVASIVELDGKKYVYLMNPDDYNDYFIGEYSNDEIADVVDPDLLENLLLKFNDDLKINLPKILEELA